MNPTPIPDHILPYCRKSNIDEWRSVLPDKQILCTHRSPGLLPDFIPRATDGIHTVVELAHDQSLHRIHASNVIWPEKPKAHKETLEVVKVKAPKSKTVVDLSIIPGLSEVQKAQLKIILGW